MSEKIEPKLDSLTPLYSEDKKKTTSIIDSEYKENVNLDIDVDSKEVNNFKKEKPKKVNIFKRTLSKIDNYLYDIEVIFEIDPNIKLERKTRNIYILNSLSAFFICFIMSYSIFTGYYYVVDKIEKERAYKMEEMKRNGGISITTEKIILDKKGNKNGKTE